MHRLFLIVFSLVMFAGSVQAQGPEQAGKQNPEQSWDNLRSLGAGERIQVVDQKLKSQNGTFVSFSEEAITFQADKGQITIQRADVFRVSTRERGRTRGRNALRGLLIGGGVGLGIGLPLFVVADVHASERYVALVAPTVEFGLIGAGIGAALRPGHPDDLPGRTAEGPNRAIAQAQLLNGGDIAMRNIQWTARQVTTVFKGRGKPIFYSAMLLLSLSAPVSSAPGSASAPDAFSKLAPEQILARMEQRFERQVQALASYEGKRRYSVAHTLLGKPAYMVVAEQYRAPEGKQFRVLERGGSAEVQERVFARLLQVEQDIAREAVRRELDLNRRNYQFTFERHDPAARAYVFTIEPRGSHPYLLRGTIWINEQDFAVQRIEGEPSHRHSMFVRETRFVHEFARFGDFWFPVRHHSETNLRLFGRAVLEISYFDYHWQVQKEKQP